jgi:hypothetical protein
MKHLIRCAVIVGAIFGALALPWFIGGANAAPIVGNCGGNQTVHYTPFDCTSSRQFTFGPLTRTVTAVMHFTGGFEASSASFTVDKSVPQDFQVRVVAHVGLSGDGLPVPPDRDVTVTFPAGSVGPIVVRFTTACGQVDVKAVFIANGDERGRVAGPYICVAVPQDTTTTTTPGTVPTTPATSTPVPAPGVSVTSGSTLAPKTGPSATLPPTGNGGPEAWQWSLVAVAVGVLLVLATRKTARA